MGRFLIVTSSNADDATEVDTNVSLFLKKAELLIKDVSDSGNSLFKVVITDCYLHKVQQIFPDDGWSSLEDFSKALDHFECETESSQAKSDKELLLANCLHDAADSLPYAGAILRVVLFDNCPDSYDDEHCDHLIPLAGAVRRLKEWHNGQTVLINKSQKIPASREILIDFGHCQVVDSLERCQLDIPSWEGKIAVVDKIEGKGLTFTGHCLKSDMWEKQLWQKVQTCSFDAPKPKDPGKSKKPAPVNLPTHPVCGRTIEVLQEVDLRTFPFFFMEPWTLSLNVQKGHPDVLLKHIQELEQVGLLARLRVYPDSSNIPSCGRTNTLNTEAWKKTILGNCCEEPAEKPVSNDVFFMYFLFLPPVCLDSSSTVDVRVVLSPREINRNVIELLFKQAVTDTSQPKTDQTDFNCDVRVLQNEAFPNLLKLLQEHQKNTAKEIYGRIKGQSKVDAEKIQKDILEIASEVQDRIITLAFQEHPTLMEYMQQENIDCPASSLQWIAESCLESAKFPEKRALQAKGVKSTDFQSYPPVDGQLGSSHIPLEEIGKRRYTTDFDINDILRMFNKDGTPVAPPFTPEKMEGRNLCRVDSTPDLNTQWPNSQSLQYHDIYYYMDENDLGLEKKYSKIRDKVLEQDTLCTFLSPIKKKPQRLQKVSPIRSSPRRRNSAQHLMIRSRSDIAHSNSPALPHHHAGKNIFKQPSLSLRSPSSQRLSLNLSATDNSASSQSFSGIRGAASLVHCSPSQPVSHSTPLSAIPCRVSPRKKVLNRSLSLASVQASPAAASSKNNRVNPIAKQGASQNTLSALSMSQKSRSMSMSDAFSMHRLQDVSSPDPPVRRSPRKSAGTVCSWKSADCQSSEDGDRLRHNSSANIEFSNDKARLQCTASAADLYNSSQHSQSTLQQPRMKRSDRHKMKLKNIIKNVLEEKNVIETDTIYSACFKNLFNVSMVLLKTLVSSQNLTEEMKNVVYSQVQQIINLEKRRCGISL